MLQETLSQRLVGGYAAGQHDLPDSEVACSLDGLGDQYIDDGFLKTGGDIRYLRRIGGMVFLNVVEESSLQPAEAEIAGIFEPGAGELDCRRHIFCRCFDDGASRISQSHDPGCFIERFSCGVVSRLAEFFEFAVIGHQHDIAVTSGDDETETGECRLCAVQPVGADMAFEVVNAYEWQRMRQCDSFGCIDADDERSGKAGAMSDCDGRDVLPGYGCIG